MIAVLCVLNIGLAVFRMITEESTDQLPAALGWTVALLNVI